MFKHTVAAFQAPDLKTVLRTGAAALVLAVASQASAQATAPANDAVVEFDMPAQSLAQALNAFGIAAERPVLFSRELVAGKRAPALRGRFSADAALTLLLADAELPYRVTDEGVVLVGDLSGGSAQGAARLRDASAVQVERQPQPEAEPRGVRSADESVETEEDEGEEGAPRRDTIVVTGTAIRGVVPDSAPLEVFTAEDIALSGATTLGRFLETLPQNVNSLNPLAAEFGPGEGNRLETGIDLRGLGVGTTLVLLNGRRLPANDGGSPDVSLIPNGAIDRIELLTDGASSIYGADAIGGVVNIILSDDLDGAQTSLSVGSVTDGDHSRVQFDQSFGTSWGSGSGLISYGYFNQNDLNTADRDFATNEDPSTLAPNDQRHNVFVTIEQELTSRLSLFGDAMISDRISDTTQTVLSRGEPNTSVRSREQFQYFVSGGFDYNFGRGFDLNIHGSYLNNTTDSAFESRFGLLTTGSDAEIYDLSAVLNGTLFALPAGDVRFAAGVGLNDQVYNLNDSRFEPALFERYSTFVFGEFFLPIVSEAQAIPGFQRVEINLSARQTDYSDFGSKVVPRAGLLWSPVSGLNLRATYAENFRAPTLDELNPTRNAATFFPLGRLPADPFSDDGSTIALILDGPGGRELVPETSVSYTLGFDFTPHWYDSLDVSFTYYNIEYEDRLGSPGSLTNTVLDPVAFAPVFIQGLTLEEFGELLSNFPDPREVPGTGTDFSSLQGLFDSQDVIIDLRLDNIAISRTDGFDVSVRNSHDLSSGQLSYGGRFSLINDSINQLRAGLPEIDLLDTLGNPVSLKYSLFAGYATEQFTAQLNMNYVDDYTDIFQDPDRPVDSWTTFDLALSYRIDNPIGFLDQTRVAFTVNNLLDEDPPFASRRVQSILPEGRGLSRDSGYDPVNANPIGRFVTVGLTVDF